MAVDPAEVATRVPEHGDEGRRPKTALSLSGGGYRAMLFHVGALRRLNEAGYLSVIDRFSSVSGGSITAAVLAVHWASLDFDGRGVARAFDGFQQAVIDFAGVGVDAGSVIGGLLTPFRSISDNVTARYEQHLFGASTLQDLPDEPPRFVITATNLQTGALLRMSKGYAADYRIGIDDDSEIRLADAVAASSAFPPVLSPKVIRVDPGTFEPTGAPGEDLHRPPFTTRLILSDGGVYDNLGLQPAEDFHTVLVSDGGGAYRAQPRVSSNWLTQSTRAWLTTDRQVRALRKHHLIDEYIEGRRLGAYWGIGTGITGYGVAHLPCPPEAIESLAAVETRLKPFPMELRRRLVNWGYAVCDAALRAHVDPTIEPADAFPFPDEGIG